MHGLKYLHKKKKVFNRFQDTNERLNVKQKDKKKKTHPSHNDGPLWCRTYGGGGSQTVTNYPAVANFRLTRGRWPKKEKGRFRRRSSKHESDPGRRRYRGTRAGPRLYAPDPHEKPENVCGKDDWLKVVRSPNNPRKNRAKPQKTGGKT